MLALRPSFDHLFEHLADTRLSVLLNIAHLCLNVGQAIFLDQLFNEHDTAVVCGYLGFKVGNVIGEVSSTTYQRVHSGLFIHNMCYTLLLEFSIFYKLKGFYRCSLLL
jgi:hypothetical protein